MADSKSEQRNYPLTAYNFRVDIAGITLRFAKVSGLAREHRATLYRHGLSFIEGEEIVKHRIDSYVPITLERGTVAGKTELYAWLEQKNFVPMEVHLCGEQGPVLTWRIAKTVPVKLSASSFDAKTNEVAIETLEVRAAGIAVRRAG